MISLSRSTVLVWGNGKVPIVHPTICWAEKKHIRQGVCPLWWWLFRQTHSSSFLIYKFCHLSQLYLIPPFSFLLSTSFYHQTPITMYYKALSVLLLSATAMAATEENNYSSVMEELNSVYVPIMPLGVSTYGMECIS